MLRVFGEMAEVEVMREVLRYGAYVGKKGCVLCLPLRRAAARLVEQGILRYHGEVDGKQVWVKAEVSE